MPYPKTLSSSDAILSAEFMIFLRVASSIHNEIEDATLGYYDHNKKAARPPCPGAALLRQK